MVPSRSILETRIAILHLLTFRGGSRDWKPYPILSREYAADAFAWLVIARMLRFAAQYLPADWDGSDASQ